MFTERDYAAQRPLIERAREKAQLWRLCLGLLVVAMTSYLLTATALPILGSLFPGQWLWDLPTGATPTAMFVLLGSFLFITLGVALALRLLHQRQLVDVLGPLPLAFWQFLRVSGALILYPAVDHYHADFPSYTERATGQTLTTGFMIWFWDTYLAGADPTSPAVQRAFPLRSDRLGSLPPTLLVTAEFDPLRDEGKAFGDKLREAGVDLQYRHFDNAAHGFACSEGPNEDYRAMMADVTGWLGRL